MKGNFPLLQLRTKLGFLVKTSRSYWEIIITIKHPSLAGKEEEVKKCLMDPNEIRISRKDRDVYMFYKKLKRRYLCVIVKYQEDQSFIVTSYETDKIKEGEVKWKK